MNVSHSTNSEPVPFSSSRFLPVFFLRSRAEQVWPTCVRVSDLRAQGLALQRTRIFPLMAGSARRCDSLIRVAATCFITIGCGVQIPLPVSRQSTDADDRQLRVGLGPKMRRAGGPEAPCGDAFRTGIIRSQRHVTCLHSQGPGYLLILAGDHDSWRLFLIFVRRTANPLQESRSTCL